MDRKLQLPPSRTAWLLLGSSGVFWAIAALGVLKSPSVSSPLVILLWLYLVLVTVSVAVATTLVAAAALLLQERGQVSAQPARHLGALRFRLSRREAQPGSVPTART